MSSAIPILGSKRPSLIGRTSSPPSTPTLSSTLPQQHHLPHHMTHLSESSIIRPGSSAPRMSTGIGGLSTLFGWGQPSLTPSNHNLNSNNNNSNNSITAQTPTNTSATIATSSSLSSASTSSSSSSSLASTSTSANISNPQQSPPQPQTSPPFQPPSHPTHLALSAALSPSSSPTSLTPTPGTMTHSQLAQQQQHQPQFPSLTQTHEDRSHLPPRTKIVCTIGPASQSVEKMRALVMAGMNVARLNFSHGDHDYHRTSITNLRDIMADSRRICAILLDTKGPEIRTGRLKDASKPVQLLKNQEFILTLDENVFGDSQRVSVGYAGLVKIVKPGQHILIDDGLIDLVVIETSPTEIKTRVTNNAILGPHKGVNLPGVVLDLPAVTQKDVADLKFGVEMGVDFIAASFVRKASDIMTIRKILGTKGQHIKIIAKIESQEGLDNFASILQASDGIMVARGDLGVEIPIEQVALAQKQLIKACNVAGKFVITATQMLASMCVNPTPTRAEASDIANAVLDGTDCVMLSSETARGKHPVESVKMMADICREAESSINHRQVSQTLRDAQSMQQISVMEAIARNSVRATFDLNAAVIIVLTETGTTARLVAKYRPSAAILTVTSSEQTARQSLASRGLFPLLVGSMIGSDSLINRVLIAASRLGMCKTGDLAVVTSGSREATAGATNEMKVIEIK